MFFAEFLKGAELYEIEHNTRSRFPPHGLEQAHFNPADRLAVPDPQVRANRAQTHPIAAEPGVFLAVEKIIKAFRLEPESRRSSLHSMIGNVFDKSIAGLSIKFVP